MSDGDLGEVLANHKVVVCLGSGGVGKTTTAAALALHAAAQGKRVLCLTIDPARRLANSLGLEEMTSSEQVVPRTLFEAHGLGAEGVLAAMMLDAKRTFDELVERHSSSVEARDRILNNRLYQYMSTSLAGTQEYMAMEKLHRVRREGDWDLIVLDTPPTSNALDFLDAPDRLVSTIDSPAMQWFIQSFRGGGKSTFGIMGRGAKFLMKGLAKFAGTEFLEAIAELVADLNDIFGGFREHAAAVSEELRGDDVAYVIVTRPHELAVREAAFLAGKLLEAGIQRDAVVVNAVHPELVSPKARGEALEAKVGKTFDMAEPARLTRRLRRALDDEAAKARADRANIKRLADHLSKAAPVIYVEVPTLEEDVHDIGGLARVAEYLTA